MEASAGMAWWAYMGLSGLYYGWQVHKYRREDRRERVALRTELDDIDQRITESQNRVYEDQDWGAKWTALDQVRTELYSLGNQVESVPYRGMSWKELAFEYRDKLRETVAVNKSVPPLRQALREVNQATGVRELEAAGGYLRALEEALRDKGALVEDYLRVFESNFKGTQLAGYSRQNRARAFAGEKGQMGADSDVIAYVSASVAKVYNSPPDWTPFPRGKFWGELRARKQSSRKDRTEVRCGQWGIDRIMLSWRYNWLPRPSEIEQEARSAARWGWFKVVCVVADKLDADYRRFVEGFNSHGLALYAHELDKNTTVHNGSARNRMFLPYFESEGKPKPLREGLMELAGKNTLGNDRLRELGFGQKETERLEAADIIYPISVDSWGVLEA